MAEITDVIRTLWSSEELKKAFLADPKAFLASKNLPVPDGVEVDVYEDTPILRHYVLPPEGAPLPEQNDPVGVVMRQAATNHTYREFAKANPKDAVRATGSMHIPDSLEIKVLENTRNKLNLVIPVNPASELSNDDLAALSGGLEKVSDNTIICSSVGGTATVACAAAAFTTPFAVAGSAIAGTGTAIGSAVADA